MHWPQRLAVMLGMLAAGPGWASGGEYLVFYEPAQQAWVTWEPRTQQYRLHAPEKTQLPATPIAVYQASRVHLMGRPPSWLRPTTTIPIHLYTEVDGQGGEDIVVRPYGHSVGQTLTVGGKKNRYPSWSPSGEKIAFQSDRGGYYAIYTMDKKGEQLAKLSQAGAADNTRPAWSPDGNRIAFQTNRDGNWEIYSLASQGGQPLNLTRSPAADGKPIWAPDGRHLAFVSRRQGRLGLYIMGAQGQNQRSVSDQLAGPGDWPPAWSPSGQHLAFSLDRKLYIWGVDDDQLVTLPLGIISGGEPRFYWWSGDLPAD
ncbi:MAG: hypothetical protein GKR89_36735 [Candidatus Latescibacteria bacterium]|nr:hypothetical protein [Candidatus Latescibacterota bacterium]